MIGDLILYGCIVCSLLERTELNTVPTLKRKITRSLEGRSQLNRDDFESAASAFGTRVIHLDAVKTSQGSVSWLAGLRSSSLLQVSCGREVLLASQLISVRLLFANGN